MAQPARTFKVLLPVFVIVLAVTVALFLLRERPAPHAVERPTAEQSAEPGTIEGGLRAGARMPDFTLHRLDGTSLKASELGSRVTLVNFWATWCEACLLEMPSLVKLHEAYQAKGFGVAAINVDDDPEKVLPTALKRLGMTFGSFVDRDQKLSELFDVSGLPLTVILDRERHILFIQVGEKDWNNSEMRSQLEKWLTSSS